MMDAPEDIRSVLAGAGVRYTRQREVIYGAIATARSHPTAEDLLRDVRDAEPGLSMATVYNTLDTLCQCGLLRKVAGSSPCRYDAVLDEHSHIRLADGRVMDVPQDLSRRLLEHLPPELIAEVESRTGVRIDRVRIELDGR
jgi:Fur family peroxide stress response transcriptional regulator